MQLSEDHALIFPYGLSEADLGFARYGIDQKAIPGLCGLS